MSSRKKKRRKSESGFIISQSVVWFTFSTQLTRRRSMAVWDEGVLWVFVVFTFLLTGKTEAGFIMFLMRKLSDETKFRTLFFFIHINVSALSQSLTEHLLCHTFKNVFIHFILRCISTLIFNN